MPFEHIAAYYRAKERRVCSVSGILVGRLALWYGHKARMYEFLASA